MTLDGLKTYLGTHVWTFAKYGALPLMAVTATLFALDYASMGGDADMGMFTIIWFIPLFIANTLFAIAMLMSAWQDNAPKLGQVLLKLLALISLTCVIPGLIFHAQFALFFAAAPLLLFVFRR